jgi:hypothetical protein
MHSRIAVCRLLFLPLILWGKHVPLHCLKITCLYEQYLKSDTNVLANNRRNMYNEFRKREISCSPFKCVEWHSQEYMKKSINTWTVYGHIAEVYSTSDSKSLKPSKTVAKAVIRLSSCLLCLLLCNVSIFISIIFNSSTFPYHIYLNILWCP